MDSAGSISTTSRSKIYYSQHANKSKIFDLARRSVEQALYRRIGVATWKQPEWHGQRRWPPKLVQTG